MSTPTEKAIALDRLAKQADSAVVPGVDYTFGVIPGPERPDRNEGESVEDYQIRFTAWREDNPNQWGVTHWDANKLGTQPTDSEIEMEVLNPPPAPILDRVQAIYRDQTIEVRAALAQPAAVAFAALSIGDAELAQAVIGASEVPAELADLKTAMLSEFDKA